MFLWREIKLIGIKSEVKQMKKKETRNNDMITNLKFELNSCYNNF